MIEYLDEEVNGEIYEGSEFYFDNVYDFSFFCCCVCIEGCVVLFGYVYICWIFCFLFCY